MPKSLYLVGLLALFVSVTFFGDFGPNRRQRMTPRDCPHDPDQLYVPAGEFFKGSTKEEREFAYELDQQRTRRLGWYEKEDRRKASTESFCIDRYPVTQARYQAFIAARRHPAPFITPEAYQLQGFLVHPYAKVKEFLWRGNSFPQGKENHPVVLVSVDDARSYCAWKGNKTGRTYRLPTEDEWEKAARGTDGRIFPWGDEWNPNYLNSGSRFGSTTPVNRFPGGASPYGIYDMVGNAFTWTQTPWDTKNFVLKGCAWDDLPGTCRTAMRHGRPPVTKHILIGFRCVSEMSERE